MPKLRQYDVTIPELFELILKMTPDERTWLLREAQQRTIKMRAVRRNCCVAILLYYEDRVHPATVTNLSFTGAFVECYIPVRIGDPVTVEFKDRHEFEKIKLKARIVHATHMGFGIRYNTVRSNAARFLQKCLDDFKPDELVKSHKVTNFVMKPCAIQADQALTKSRPLPDDVERTFYDSIKPDDTVKMGLAN